MFQLHVVPGCLGPGKGKIVPQRGVAEEPLHGLDLADEGTEEKRRGLGAAWPVNNLPAGLGPVIPTLPVSLSKSKQVLCPG